jgi:uroporphyrinogen decarboxylase
MPTLTGRERLLRTLQRQPVDHISVSPFIHINYVKEFYNSHDVDWVEKTPEVYRHFGFDIIHRNCSPAADALGPAGPDWEVEKTVQKNGRDETTTTIIHTPAGDLRCVEALNWTYEFDAESSPLVYPIQSEEDFERFVRYQPAMDAIDMTDIRRARQAVGEGGIVAPWIQGAFNLLAIYYRKLDDLLTDALVNPDFYHRMMRYFLDRYKLFVQQIIDAGPDVLSYAGNIANAKLVSPRFYRAYILPYEREFVDFIQSQGVIVLYHNCGYARNLLPLYTELGLGAYESLTPPPYGDTVLEDAVQVFGQETALSGNIDQITLLREGTPAEIEAVVKQTLDTVRGRSHFILATTDYFNEATPHDSIHALAEAGLAHGRL